MVRARDGMARLQLFVISFSRYSNVMYILVPQKLFNSRSDPITFDPSLADFCFHTYVIYRRPTIKPNSRVLVAPDFVLIPDYHVLRPNITLGIEI